MARITHLHRCARDGARPGAGTDAPADPARHGAPKDGPSYADLPRDVEPIDTSFLEEKPPPSWGSEGWNWGSANGAAHDKAAIVRAQFAKRHRRTSFMAWAKCGTVDAGDLKMALALSCQRARNLGYDEDGKWESLMDEMAAAQYMDAKLEFIDYPKLAGRRERAAAHAFYVRRVPRRGKRGHPRRIPVAVVARALRPHPTLAQRRCLTWPAVPRAASSARTRAVFPNRPLPWTRPCAFLRWPRASRRPIA